MNKQTQKQLQKWEGEYVCLLPIVRTAGEMDAMLPYSAGGVGKPINDGAKWIIDCGWEGYWPADKLKWVQMGLNEMRWPLSEACESAIIKCGGYFQLSLKEL